MAISVNREGNSDGTIDLTINIATTAFFNEFWERAIKEMNVKIFRENSHLGKNQLNSISLILKQNIYYVLTIMIVFWDAEELKSGWNP